MEEVKEVSFHCNKSLLQSFGLPALEQSQSMKVKICRQIKSSCCPLEKMQDVLDNFVTNGTEKRLRKSVKNIKTMYNILFETMEKVDQFSKKIQGVVSNNPLNSCNVLT